MAFTAAGSGLQPPLNQRVTTGDGHQSRKSPNQPQTTEIRSPRSRQVAHSFSTIVAASVTVGDIPNRPMQPPLSHHDTALSALLPLQPPSI
ncbi:hypothetical protein WN944_029561 [Citrus x changshan-huyou]|uniref:Uncharacterized protein n=1 Tax=Citrus x changshan-huyou TaxID=2935761 RepID=A0AAP0LMH2_9ROSI